MYQKQDGDVKDARYACSKKKANKNASSERSSLKTRYVYVCRI